MSVYCIQINYLQLCFQNFLWPKRPIVLSLENACVGERVSVYGECFSVSEECVSVSRESFLPMKNVFLSLENDFLFLENVFCL